MHKYAHELTWVFSDIYIMGPDAQVVWCFETDLMVNLCIKLKKNALKMHEAANIYQQHEHSYRKGKWLYCDYFSL